MRCAAIARRAGSASSHPPGRPSISSPTAGERRAQFFGSTEGTSTNEASAASEFVRERHLPPTCPPVHVPTTERHQRSAGVSSEARPGRSGTDLWRPTGPTYTLCKRRQVRRGECERSEHLAARVASAKPSVRRRLTIDLWRSEREARAFATDRCASCTRTTDRPVPGRMMRRAAALLWSP